MVNGPRRVSFQKPTLLDFGLTGAQNARAYSTHARNLLRVGSFPQRSIGRNPIAQETCTMATDDEVQQHDGQTRLQDSF